jgi:hypothetical protein
MNPKPQKEFMFTNRDSLDIGKEVTGDHKVYVNGETFFTHHINIRMRCNPTGCSKTVYFTGPEEGLITRYLGIGLQLYLPPGTYPIEGTDNAWGSYMISRRTPDGSYFATAYDVTGGYITLDDWDLDSLYMKGSFAYTASVENLPQLITGKFMLKDLRP